MTMAIKNAQLLFIDTYCLPIGIKTVSVSIKTGGFFVGGSGSAGL